MVCIKEYVFYNQVYIFHINFQPFSGFQGKDEGILTMAWTGKYPILYNIDLLIFIFKAGYYALTRHRLTTVIIELSLIFGGFLSTCFSYSILRRYLELSTPLLARITYLPPHPTFEFKLARKLQNIT